MTASQMQMLDRASRARRRSAILPLVLAGVALALLVAAVATLIASSQHATTTHAATAPWVALGVVALLAAALWALFAGFLADRRRLTRLTGEVLQLARTDPLTGLPNRRRLQDSLAEAMAHARRYDEPLSVLMIDLDRFKRINDTHGHDTGDRVLRAVAACMTEVLRDCDVYGRWGGDEFLAVLGHTSLDGARGAAQRLCECAGALDLRRAGIDTGVRLSIGCAAAGNDVAEVLHAADAAMYEAKRRGQGGVAVARERALV
jgi:diguanylate cyclase (GGDEF)-like protein